MKKNIIAVIGAILVGILFAVVMFFETREEAYGMVINDNMINAFQIGVFSNIDNANKLMNSYDGSIVVKDDDMYRVYIGMFMSEDLTSRYRSHCANLGIDYYVKKVIVNEEFLDVLGTYEEILLNSDIEIYELNKDILASYEEFI